MRTSLLSYKMPELKGPHQGVFSKIPRHDANYDNRYFETTYKNSYETNFKDFNPLDSRSLNKNYIFSGSATGFKKSDRVKISSNLIAEKYNSKKKWKNKY